MKNKVADQMSQAISPNQQLVRAFTVVDDIVKTDGDEHDAQCFAQNLAFLNYYGNELSAVFSQPMNVAAMTGENLSVSYATVENHADAHYNGCMANHRIPFGRLVEDIKQMEPIV